nr:hypothetical protein JVH1_0695 [Rhodococcus sp. JVH1]
MQSRRSPSEFEFFSDSSKTDEVTKFHTGHREDAYLTLTIRGLPM